MRCFFREHCAFSKRAATCCVLLTFVLSATSVPGLSFEDLTDRSELIVSGQIVRSWSEWDAEHKFIWTHSELRISGSLKGAAGATVTVSEPGGIVGSQGMTIAGTAIYKPGDQVLLFLSRMPNGYLRTTGWGQGKYNVDAAGRVHADASLGAVELRVAGANSAGTSLRTLNGMTLQELTSRIRARLGRVQ